VDAAATERLAELAVHFGANVQPGQIVAVEAETGMESVVRAVAASAYLAGARFVDVTYNDPYVKRSRLEHAAPETLGFVPKWYGNRVLAYGENRAARIVFSPRVSPGVLDGVDPERAGRDELPDLPERLVIINEQTTNWCALPYPTRPWAGVVHPELEPEDAYERLSGELVRICRLDEEDPAAAWRARMDELGRVAARLTELRLDSIRYHGPGTDLTVGLFPSSEWETALLSTRDGVAHMANIPSEEISTTPDPSRAEGVVRATKPLELGGALIQGLTVRFEGGRAVEIEAETGAETLRTRAAVDEDAARLGEVALVDREGRIGSLGTIFYTTLIDENAASHVALGNAYSVAVGEEDRDRINKSGIHIDFMIGGDDVSVTGITGDGREIPILQGTWQI
jgi:aminopeptidase